MTHLSVNINKVALIRNSRGRDYPSVSWFAERCLELGAHGITLHPRPDQRHARYSDVHELRKVVDRFPGTELNVEGNPTPDFLDVVIAAKAHQCTLVPDAPGQLTSDHGWNVRAEAARLEPILARLRAAGVRSSIFIDYDSPDFALARQLGADRVELYTEPYAQHFENVAERTRIRDAFGKATATARAAGLGVNAGHDLNLENLAHFLEIPGILEVSIGHALIVECLAFGVQSVLDSYLRIVRAAA
ncbi:MAG: pyridoxine 5'-phosphate synthase [Verrucomicrobiota bacterium]